MLELIGVVLTDGGTSRLDRLGLEVRAGEVLGLAGPTRAGKSSALEVMAGRRSPDRGRLLLGGRDVSRKPERLAAVAGLAQAPPGPEDLSVGQWLVTWAALDGVPAKERGARIEAERGRFGLADGERRVGQLSHGDRQRLSLARLFVRAPSILLLDDPAQGLDGDGLRALTQALRARAAAGDTVVIAAAAPHLLTTVCDRVVRLAEGREQGETRRGEADFAAAVARAQGWAT